MLSKYGTGNDPACYLGSHVLINLLNIRDAEELADVEQNLTAARAATFEPEFTRFNLSTLQAVHFHLFQDVYPWAGALRTVELSKGSTRFCVAAYIEAEASKLFQKLALAAYLVDLCPSDFIAAISHYYCELNVIHPFREGNGRAQRLFFELLAINAGYGLDWSGVESDEWLNANIAGYAGELGPLQTLFTRIVQVIA